MSRIYIEGGGDSKELHVRCREGFRRLLQKSGFEGRMPRLIACGTRAAAFDDFLAAHEAAGRGEYIAVLVDSESPVSDVERTWQHLQSRDGWAKPCGADDEQVLLMTTCMETWLASDRGALHEHYGACLRENALPRLNDMEERTRGEVQIALAHATRECRRPYSKGQQSFAIVGKIQPAALREHLPSFVRWERILKAKL